MKLEVVLRIEGHEASRTVQISDAKELMHRLAARGPNPPSITEASHILACEIQDSWSLGDVRPMIEELLARVAK